MKRRPAKEVKKALTKKFVDELMTDLARLKARCKMLRKLRHVVVVTVQDPSGNILACLSLPYFVYEKSIKRLDFIKDAVLKTHNQTVKVLDVSACDTLVDLEAEIVALNQVDDQKEDDGIEDNR